MLKNGPEKSLGIPVPKTKEKDLKPRKYSKGVWVLYRNFVYYLVFYKK